MQLFDFGMSPEQEEKAMALHREAMEETGLAVDASEMHWSPAGDRIVVALAPTPLVDDHYMHRRLRVVDPATGTVTAAIEKVAASYQAKGL